MIVGSVISDLEGQVGNAPVLEKNLDERTG